MENNKKGITWGIIFGLATWIFPLIFYTQLEPYLEKVMLLGGYDNLWDALPDLQPYLLDKGDDTLIPLYGIIPFAVFSFALAIIAPLILKDDDEMRIYVRIFLFFSAVHLIFYLVVGIQMGSGNIVVFIANLVFTFVSISMIVGKQQGIEAGDSETLPKIVIFIFKD